MQRRRGTATLPLLPLLLLLGLVACNGSGTPEAGTSGAVGGSPGPAPSGVGTLTGQHPCAAASGFSCATLWVPLDHSGHRRGRLGLQVAVADTAGPAPRGIFLLLAGGPGQPGVPFASLLSRALAPALSGYRFVMFDQRGTGGGALDCPALQRAMGSSDLRVPPPAAVTACASALGSSRRYFTTADTVADIEMLRSALGARRLTLDGISYGSYVAEHYALAYPGRVARLLLDSVVPQTGADPWELANIQAAARVLRDVCRSQHCGYDPAANLAAVVAAHGGGPALLDALVLLSVIDPSFHGVLGALHAARAGATAALDNLVNGLTHGDNTPASGLSQGLHASTLCEDMSFPWGDAATPLAWRPGRLARAAARLTAAQTWPFGRATAMGNGLIRTCLYWPPEPAEAATGRARLPRVPVLLLAGARDLSTPLAWARAEAAFAPDGRLIVVPGDGHAVQVQRMSASVIRAIQRFLDG